MAKPLVNEFLRQGTLDYPGRRYERNFITDNETLFDIPSATPEAFDAIEEYLKEKNLPPLSERIPVIAYGANVSPGAMTSKFSKYPIEGTNVSYEEMHTVPVVYGAIEGSDVVWHGRPAQAGGYFAELYQAEETKDTTVQVAVEFLTPEQLAVMHTTEGDTYGVSSTDVTLPDGYTIEGIFYGAREASVLLDAIGEPISVAGVQRAGSDRRVMTPTQAMGYTLSTDAVREKLGQITTDEYVAEVAELPLKDRKALQVLVQRALQLEGKSAPINHPSLKERNYGRTNFISLPRGVESAKAHSNRVELMEQSIARIRLPKEDRERKISERRTQRPNVAEKLHRVAVDPAERLRELNTNALTDPNRAKALAKAVPGRVPDTML